MRNKHAFQVNFTQDAVTRSEYLVLRTKTKDYWMNEFYEKNIALARYIGTQDKESFYAALESIFGPEAQGEYLVHGVASFTVLSGTPFTYETSTGTYDSWDMVDMYKAFYAEEIEEEGITDEQLLEMVLEEYGFNPNLAFIDLTDVEQEIKFKGVSRVPMRNTATLPLLTTSMGTLLFMELGFSPSFDYNLVGLFDILAFESAQDYGAVYGTLDERDFLYAPLTLDADSVVSFLGLDGTSDISGLFGLVLGSGEIAVNGLRSLPTSGFESLKNVTKCSYAFAGCVKVTSNVELLYRYLSTKPVPVMEHESCFSACSSAEGFYSIPDDWGGLCRGSVHIRYTGADPSLDTSGMTKQEAHDVFKDTPLQERMILAVSSIDKYCEISSLRLNGREIQLHTANPEENPSFYAHGKYLFLTKSQEWKDYYEQVLGVEVDLVDDDVFDLEYNYGAMSESYVPMPHLDSALDYTTCVQLIKCPSLAMFSDNCLYHYVIVESFEMFKNTRVVDMGDIRVLWIPEEGYENLSRIQDCKYAMGWSNGNAGTQPLRNDILGLYEYLSTKPEAVASFEDMFKYCTLAENWSEVSIDWGGGKLMPTSSYTEVEYYGDEPMDVIVTSSSYSTPVLFKNMELVGTSSSITVRVSRGDRLQLKGYGAPYYRYETPILSSATPVTEGVFDIKKFDHSGYFGTGALFKYCELIGKVSSWEGLCGDLDNMFACCTNLVSVPGDMSVIRSTDAYMLDSANFMFYGCMKLESEITAWPVFKENRSIDIRAMFFECRKLKSVPQFDTSGIMRSDSVNMSRLFYGCRELNIDAKAFYDSLAPYSSGDPLMMFFDCTSCVNYESLPDNIRGVRIGSSRYPYMVTSASCDKEVWLTANFHEVLGTLGTDCTWVENDPTNEKRYGMNYAARAYLDETKLPTSTSGSTEVPMSVELTNMIGGGGWRVPPVSNLTHIGDLSTSYFYYLRSLLYWKKQTNADCRGDEFDSRPESYGGWETHMASCNVSRDSGSYYSYAYAYSRYSENSIRQSSMTSQKTTAVIGVLRLYQPNAFYVSLSFYDGDDYACGRFQSSVHLVDGWTRTIPIKWAEGDSSDMFTIEQPSGCSITAVFDADGNVRVSNVSTSTVTASRNSVYLKLKRK